MIGHHPNNLTHLFAVTLLITILNVNDKAPIFAPPWTSTKPVYNISVKEEQLPGAFVMVMVASDPDGSVSKYEITDDPEGFFSIDPRTGKERCILIYLFLSYYEREAVMTKSTVIARIRIACVHNPHP